MAGRKTLLTPLLQRRIVRLIRKGAFDWVAAQACGIDPRTFYRWLEAGDQAHARPLFRQFCREVRAARAHARTVREIVVAKTNAPFWLRCGPGRDRPGEPGWTESAQVTVNQYDEVKVVVEYVNAPPASAFAGTSRLPTNGATRGKTV